MDTQTASTDLFHQVAAAASEKLATGDFNLVVQQAGDPLVSLRPGSIAAGVHRIAVDAYQRGSAAVLSNPRTAGIVAGVAIAAVIVANRRKVVGAGYRAAYWLSDTAGAAAYRARNAIHQATAPAAIVTGITPADVLDPLDAPAITRKRVNGAAEHVAA